MHADVTATALTGIRAVVPASHRAHIHGGAQPVPVPGSHRNPEHLSPSCLGNQRARSFWSKRATPEKYWVLLFAPPAAAEEAYYACGREIGCAAGGSEVGLGLAFKSSRAGCQSMNCHAFLPGNPNNGPANYRPSDSRPLFSPRNPEYFPPKSSLVAGVEKRSGFLSKARHHTLWPIPPQIAVRQPL
jgi:hypothetical protein